MTLRLMLLLPLLCGTVGATQLNYDIYVYSVGHGPNNNPNNVNYYGQAGGIAAYSFATQICNSGNTALTWRQAEPLHPVIGQNLFRLKDGRFEQVGQSWLKHGFCALSEIEAGCAPCQATNCNTLGLGCADTYSASLNDGRTGGSKSEVSPTVGTHIAPVLISQGNNTIRGRLQARVADLSPELNPGAKYFIEGQYIASQDHLSGNSLDNFGWREITFPVIHQPMATGPTDQGRAAIYAWKAVDPAVQVNVVINTREGLGEIDAYYHLAYKATDLGGGQWRYDYALHNATSKQGAFAFQLPVPQSVNVSNFYFHDVDYHSGDPYDGTDWIPSHQNGAVRWEASQTFTENANANALRWGTMYTFGFEADAGPAPDMAAIDLFQPGMTAVLNSQVDVPFRVDPPVAYCTSKLNSCGTPATISWTGAPSAGAGSGFTISGGQAADNKLGLLIYSDAGRMAPAGPFAQTGFLCIQPPIRRSPAVLSSGGTPGACDSSFVLDMNAFAAGQAGGNPNLFLSVPGTMVNAQWWGRDNVQNGEYLSNAVEYVVAP